MEGALVTNVGPREAERLKMFEGSEYDLGPLVVRRPNGGLVGAHMFMAKTSVAGSADTWDLAHWRRRHKRRYLARLRGAGHLGH